MTKPTDTRSDTMTKPDPITVTDNTGRSYTARILTQGDPYGRSAIWGYQQGRRRLGITIDGTPATYYADGFVGKAEAQRVGGQLAIDSGAGWLLTEESTLRFYRLADAAFAARPRAAGSPANHGGRPSSRRD